jgi:hypothetical protein
MELDPDGVTLAPLSSDDENLKWEVSLDPNQQLTDDGSSALVKDSDGETAATITSEGGEDVQIQHIPETETDPASDRVVVDPGADNPEVTIRPAVTSSGDLPCVTDQQIDSANTLNEEYLQWVGPPALEAVGGGPSGAIEDRAAGAPIPISPGAAEVWALVRASDEQDAATFLVAAFCGLRMGEVLALTWREVDFTRRVIRVRASYTHHRLDTPKSSSMRAVPMADPVARALDQLSHRENSTDDGDLMFPNLAGNHQNPKQLRKRYRIAQGRACLRGLSFHDLRHTFGTLAINRADPVSVQHWMGHANLQTTMRYLHFRQRDDEADLLSDAFEEKAGPEIGPEEGVYVSN